LVGFTLLQSQGKADVTGKLNIVEFLPFVAVLWVSTAAFGIVGAAAAWTLRSIADALIMLWLSGMKKRDLLPLLPSAALLVASLVAARLLGSNILVNLCIATLAASASVALGYVFSEDCRKLILAQVNRARVVLGGLTGRAKPISPVDTRAQK
jgi:O-antigen/teichoic acid export membrane protein